MGHGLVSLRRAQNRVFKVYVDSWKFFKPNYFLARPISLLARGEFCVVPLSLMDKLTARDNYNAYGLRNIFLKVQKVIRYLMKLLMRLIKI